MTVSVTERITQVFARRRRALWAAISVALLAGGLALVHGAPVAAALPEEDPDADRLIVFTDYVTGWLGGVGSSLFVMQGEEAPKPFYDRQGCDDYEPTFSPDGTRIAFNSCWTIRVASADGLTPLSEVEVLPCPLTWCRDASWSPDGTRIVFAASPLRYPPSLTEWDLWVVDADGSDLKELYAGPGAQRHPSWSPDGRRIAFSNNATGGQFDFDVVSVNTRGRKLRVIADQERLEREPVYSPDGRKIVFVRRANSGSLGLFVKNLVTGRLRQITPDGVSYIEPAWSPSGHWIAYGSYSLEEELFQLFKVRSDGSSPPVMIHASGWGPTWRP